MTSNQVSYWNLIEQQRSNREREKETNRSNLIKEGETHRSNVAKERENERSNQVKEMETARHNRTQEELGYLELPTKYIGSVGKAFKLFS